jgi:hypothetical protein
MVVPSDGNAEGCLITTGRTSMAEAKAIRKFRR